MRKNSKKKKRDIPRFAQTVTRFEDAGYIGKIGQTDNYKGVYYSGSHNGIRFMITRVEIMAETEKTFNKWSQVYYQRGLIEGDNDAESVFADIELLKTKEHIKSANECGRYFK